MSTFGNLFQVTTFGESHCYGVGCIVTGVPPRMRLSADDIQTQLNRRRPGQSKLTTQRNEKDQALIMSGVEFGYTLGTPIAVLVRNEDQRPGDYGGSSHMHDIPRPSHADYTYQEKYGIRASSGGGRASARETIGRVIAGAVAEKWLEERYTPNASIHEKFSIVAYVSSVANIHAPEFTDQQHHELTRDIVDMNLARCPDADTANRMIQAITEAKASHDNRRYNNMCHKEPSCRSRRANVR
jgi:chorismate synthase